ncbi:MAG: periplasmic heavy metal sensor [Candidatus Eisenbacteria bacterium]
MKWSWVLVIVLALSIGLNIGLTIKTRSGVERAEGRFDPPPFLRGPRGEKGGRPGEFARHHIERLADRLGLDEEEREAMRAVASEMMPLILEQRTRVHEGRTAIHDAYGVAGVDPAHVRALVGELSRAQAKLDSLVAETMLREMETLSPEQREKYFRSMPWEGGRGEVYDRGRGPRRKR